MANKNYLYRLKELMKIKNISIEEMKDLLAVEESTVKAYQNGYRQIPYESLVKIADKYNVSLDWLFGRSEFTNERDAMSSIFLSLEKVFDYKEHTQSGYPVLYIDKQFANYLKAIHYIRYARPVKDPDYSKYSKEIETVQNIYKEYFANILGVSNFNAEEAAKVIFSEDLQFVDLVGELMSLNSQ